MTQTLRSPATRRSGRDITVRRPGIDHEQPLPKHFVADDPMRSHIAAMLSSVFPEGEDFFVRSVRAYRDQITDPELSKQVKGFIGQEAIQLHGGGGLSDDHPLAGAWTTARALRLADGPDEVHRRQVAKRELARYEPTEIPPDVGRT